MGRREFPQRHMKRPGLGVWGPGRPARTASKVSLFRPQNFTPLKGSRATHSKNKRFLPSVAGRPSSGAPHHAHGNPVKGPSVSSPTFVSLERMRAEPREDGRVGRECFIHGQQGLVPAPAPWLSEARFTHLENRNRNTSL